VATCASPVVVGAGGSEGGTNIDCRAPGLKAARDYADCTTQGSLT
jgi:hypothetical protein